MKKVVSILIIFCLLALPSISFADTDYKYINGNIIKWRIQSVPVCVEGSAKKISGIYDAVNNSIALWSSISSAPNLYLSYNIEDCKIHISMGKTANLWEVLPLATNTIFAYQNGGICYSEIVINEYFNGKFGDATINKNVYDLQSVISHEMGHALGLEEEYSDTTSVMYEKFKLGKTIKREAKSADIRSVIKLYE